MSGCANTTAKWGFLKDLDPDVAILQEARLPIGMSGHASRRHVKPALDRDDVVVVTKGPSISCRLADAASGQALEISYEGIRIFGVRSYLQFKEYYPKALLRIVDAIATHIKAAADTPTIIAGDFNASLDQAPGRNWTLPFRRLHELGFIDAVCLKNDCPEGSLPCTRDHGRTFRNSRGRYRIDHLYVDRSMGKRLHDIRINEDGWQLSDHCPVIADF